MGQLIMGQLIITQQLTEKAIYEGEEIQVKVNGMVKEPLSSL